jgi:hypothetical protein
MALRWPAVAWLLALSCASCSRRPVGAEEGVPGEASEALSSTYVITDVQSDGNTYHFDSPRFVLEASEGAGPRVLAVTVAGYVAPLVSTTLSQHPKGSDISAAVGYSLAEAFYLQASAAYTVERWDYKRLEAYINYARTAWVVRDAACGAVLGTGMSFKPIGVYFAVRDTANAAIPGTSVINCVPGCTGGPCGYALDPTTGLPEASDADAGVDAGAGDGGRP